MSTPTRVSSRLQKIEDRKNRQQALLFILLSIGFILLLIFVGFPLFVKAAVFIGDMKSSSQVANDPDVLPPAAPRLVSDYEATNSATIKLKGFAEPGTSVTLIKNGVDRTDAVTTDDGTFIFPSVKLMGGENRFQTIAKNSANKESQPSEEIIITYDEIPPELTVTSPNEGQEFFDDNREIVVAGKTDQDADVTVNDYIVTLDQEGNFVKKLLLTNGDNEIKVITKDKAGNRTEKTIKVKYTN